MLAVHDIDRVVEAARAHDLKVDQLEQRNPSSRRRPRTADNPASAAARFGGDPVTSEASFGNQFFDPRQVCLDRSRNEA